MREGYFEKTRDSVRKKIKIYLIAIFGLIGVQVLVKIFIPVQVYFLIDLTALVLEIPILILLFVCFYYYKKNKRVLDLTAPILMFCRVAIITVLLWYRAEEKKPEEITLVLNKFFGPRITSLNELFAIYASQFVLSTALCSISFKQTLFVTAPLFILGFAWNVLYFYQRNDYHNLNQESHDEVVKEIAEDLFETQERDHL